MTRTVMPWRQPGASIPSVIHQMWVSTPVPEIVAHHWERWDEFAAEHGYVTRRITDATYDRTYTARAFPLHQVRAMKGGGAIACDLLRCEMLYREGGIYFDSDMLPLRPFDRFLGAGRPPFMAFGTDEDSGTGLLNYTIGSPAGWTSAYEVWEQGVAALGRGLVNPLAIAGPQRWKRVLEMSTEDVGFLFVTEAFRDAKDAQWRGAITSEGRLDDEALRALYPRTLAVHVGAHTWTGTKPEVWRQRYFGYDAAKGWT